MFLALREIVVNAFSPLTLSQFSEHFDFNSLVRHSYTKHIVVSLPPLIYCMWSSFSECLFVCLFWAIYAWQVLKVSDDLDREKEAGDFSLFAQRVSVVELPLEIVLSWKRKDSAHCLQFTKYNYTFGDPSFSLLLHYCIGPPTCWIHLLDENREVEPALSCLKIKQA